jgi:flagellar biosynthesis protein FlhF
LRVKKYQAADMPTALAKIKEELGPHAVILSTREVRPGKGVLGVLARSLVEVTAAADVDRPGPPPRGQAVPGSPGADSSPILALQAEVESLREELALMERRARAPGPAVVSRDVQVLAEKVDRLLERTTPVDRMQLGPMLRQLLAHLEAADLEPTLAARIVHFLQEKVDRGTVPPGRELDAFREFVARTLRVGGGPGSGRARSRVVALVGPTGVGKTTTVAKLAARAALQQGGRVGLVTVDTFRIAAVEQLKTYAKIMAVPLRVAEDAGQFRAAVEEFSDRDLVLVDTAGRSPRDEEALAELLALFPADLPVEVHLVLSVTTRSRDLEQILGRYARLGASRLILTKLDETGSHGALLGLPLASRLPLSYVTTGQNVPDDIEEATAAGVCSYLLRGLEAPG